MQLRGSAMVAVDTLVCRLAFLFLRTGVTSQGLQFQPGLPLGVVAWELLLECSGRALDTSKVNGEC